MFLAEKSVKNYVSRPLAKLGMERRAQAAVFVSKLAPAAARQDLAPGPHSGDDHRCPRGLDDGRAVAGKDLLSAGETAVVG